MKLIICFASLFVVLIGQGSALPFPEFRQKLQEIDDYFGQVHVDFDIYIAQSFLNISDVFTKVNVDAVKSAAASVDSIQAVRKVLANEILDRADELGNQNQCLINIEQTANQNINFAGNAISSCSRILIQNIDTTREAYIFWLATILQLESSSAQTVIHYGLGAFNQLTNQESVINRLEYVMVNSAHEIEEAKEMYEAQIESVNNSFTTFQITYNECAQRAFNNFDAIVNSLRVEVANC